MNTTVASLRTLFSKALALEKVSEAQKKDMEHSFTTGAAAMFHLIMNATEESLSDDEGVQMIEALRLEIMGFEDSIKKEALNEVMTFLASL